MPEYKLTYFNVKALGEPIRLLLSYMGKEFEDCRISIEEWPKLKEQTPFGKLPILEIDGKTYCQSTAILRYLAIEAGLSGSNADENMEIDIVVGAFGDLATDVSRHYKMDIPSVKEKLKEILINETIPFYMKKLENLTKKNGGYLANGKIRCSADRNNCQCFDCNTLRQGSISGKDIDSLSLQKLAIFAARAHRELSWADLYVVGYCSSLPGLIGIDLLEKYPAFKELTERVHSLPGIKEWVQKRPETAI